MYKVLIVEDDPMVASINSIFLEKYSNLEVINIAKNEEEVFEILEKNCVDLILCDVYLGESNGIEILKKIRSKGILTDIIFITALNESNKIKEAVAFGAIDFLIKPYNQARLDAAIGKFLKKNELLIKTTMDQEECDEYFSSDSNQTEFPKGINEKTLEKIELFLSENRKKWWNANKLSEQLNISTVTLNKYLKYLVSTNKLTVNTSYGEVGRPENFYKYHN
ncbi:Imm15 family immunity protein [Cetobacterium somerae]|uniref:response regulator n=1 Tax=Cetobacterium somerae TaxID=188913 RepID=UPI001F070EA5|nr:Imm15 family immunity protein [Cetobacterium somerae]MCX3067077.1 Imm15 family immunity protein [Cetobacterium somerae]UPO98792.1 Imm15 family immunity protein [Cetobacterium somerae]